MRIKPSRDSQNTSAARENARAALKAKRLNRLYMLLRATAARLVVWRLRFVCAPLPALPQPFICVANHTNDFDIVLVGRAIPHPMRFIASEHIFRNPLARFLLIKLFDPLIRRKGGADTGVALRALRLLRSGTNIALFPEGSKSFAGLPLPVKEATGQLVKASRAALVTLRITGGYFSSPRWNPALRRGAMRGEVVRVYTPIELAGMTYEQVNAAITGDLYMDHTAVQRAENTVYRRKRGRAAGIERLLYLCPQCGAYTSLRGENNHISCACGLSVLYTQTGFLQGEGTDFRTLRDWALWQRARLGERLLRAGEGEALFPPDEGALYVVDDAHGRRIVARGQTRMTARRLVCGDIEIALEDIDSLDCCGANRLVFAAKNGAHHELVGREKSFNALKYMEALDAARGRNTVFYQAAWEMTDLPDERTPFDALHQTE